MGDHHTTDRLLPPSGRPMPIGSGPRYERDGGAAPVDPFASPAYFEEVWSRRAIAFLIDHAIGFGLAIGLFAVTLAFSLFAFVATFGLLWPFFSMPMIVLMVAYYALTIGSSRRASLGMRLMGIEVRSWAGGSPTVWQAALCAALFYATVLPTAGLALLFALVLGRGRTLHELVSGCVVVNRIYGPEVIPPGR